MVTPLTHYVSCFPAIGLQTYGFDHHSHSFDKHPLPDHIHVLVILSFQPQFLFALAQVLGNNAASNVARPAAGLYLKNCLHSKDETTNLQLQQRWLQIDAQARLEIKKVVCTYMSSGRGSAVKSEGQCHVCRPELQI